MFWNRVWAKTTGLVQYARVFTDLPSIQGFRALRDQRAIGDLVELRLRSLGGKSVYCRPGTSDVHVLADAFFCGYHLPPHRLPDACSILDLGSNIGLTVAHYAALYPRAKIVGIELDPGNHAVCMKNIASWSSRCEVIRGAVWTHEGTVSYTGSSEWGFHVTSDAEGVRGTVPAWGVAALLDRLGGGADFVKMDVEGAEKELLKTAAHWASRVRCLKVEVHSPYTIEECAEDLARLGFECAPDSNRSACMIASRR